MLGDWLAQELKGGGNPPFNAPDLLHEATGVDVITFGRGGASNLSATAYLTQKRTVALKRFGLGAPADVLVFVYEGNDFLDNLVDARKSFDLGLERPLSGYSDAELDAVVAETARRGSIEGLAGTFTLPYLLLNLARGPRPGWNTGAARSRWSRPGRGGPT